MSEDLEPEESIYRIYDRIAGERARAEAKAKAQEIKVNPGITLTQAQLEALSAGVKPLPGPGVTEAHSAREIKKKRK